MSKYELKIMIYDEGYHIDEILDDGLARRVFCSKNFKCKNFRGQTDWCAENQVYQRSYENDSIPLESATEIPKAVKILFLKGQNE
jgi:hypothetical protein